MKAFMLCTSTRSMRFNLSWPDREQCSNLTALHGIADSIASQVEVSKGLKEELANPGRELLKIVKLPSFPTRVCISHSHV